MMFSVRCMVSFNMSYIHLVVHIGFCVVDGVYNIVVHTHIKASKVVLLLG